MIDTLGNGNMMINTFIRAIIVLAEIGIGILIGIVAAIVLDFIGKVGD